MPIIPKRGQSLTPQNINLGRVTTTEPPGIAEQTRLQQFDRIVSSGAKLADVFLKRKESRDKELSDLAVNEAILIFKAGSREAKLEIGQRTGQDVENSFSDFKKAQDKAYKNSIKGLTPDQVSQFNQLAGPIGLDDNTQIAAFQATAHNNRINQNYESSSFSAKTRAFDFITNKPVFDKNIAESIRLNDELLKRKGMDDVGREEVRKKLLSSSVSEGITLISAISADRAETWFNQSLEDGELSTQDSIKLRSMLDKRKNANEEENLLIWAQSNADHLIGAFGENREELFREIEKKTSGKNEVALKKEVGLRLKQISDQTEENQRALLKRGKEIIDNSLNATEARKQILSVTADRSAEIDTANKLNSYIENAFEKAKGRVQTNYSAQDSLYTRINKTFADTASNKEVISSVEQIEVEYAGKLSQADMKAAVAYYRNNGFFGKTAYTDLLQSFANMKESSIADVRKNKEAMKEFGAFLNYARPLLPPDKVVSPFDLQKLSSTFFIQGQKEGKTFSPEGSIWRTGFDNFADETYKEAVLEGEGLYWLPELRFEESQIAKKLIADENKIRASQGEGLYWSPELLFEDVPIDKQLIADWLPELQSEDVQIPKQLIEDENKIRASQRLRPIIDNKKNREIIYKQRVMLLDYSERP